MPIFKYEKRVQRFKKIMTLKELGWTVRRIGKHLGITGQRVHQIIENGHPVKRTKRHPEYTKIKRLEIIQLLGNICASCGFDDIRALQLDHINGKGNKDRKKNGYYKILSGIIKKEAEGDMSWRKEYQCLCANCNWIKRDTNNEVPKVRVLESRKSDYRKP